MYVCMYIYIHTLFSCLERFVHGRETRNKSTISFYYKYKMVCCEDVARFEKSVTKTRAAGRV